MGKRFDLPRKSQTNPVAGFSYAVEWHAVLFDAARVHHYHTIGQRQRLGLIVRDHQCGDADGALDPRHLDLHFLAQFGVEVG